jgi:ABC-type amino acid transport system permease subunit
MSLLASVEILRKTIIYSSFVALITISDLFRNAMAVYTSTNIPYYIFGAMLVYLILSVGLKLVQKGLRILLFKPVAPEADQTAVPEESAD